MRTSTTLPMRLPWPIELSEHPVGILPPAFLTRDRGGVLYLEGRAPARHDRVSHWLLDMIGQHAPGIFTHGTIGGRLVEGPVTAGEWHVDSGEALRYVVTLSPVANLACGHEFRVPYEGVPHGPLPEGVVAAFAKDEHRRPAVDVDTRRVFLSVALYPPGVDPDLSCPLLAALRPQLGTGSATLPAEAVGA